MGNPIGDQYRSALEADRAGQGLADCEEMADGTFVAGIHGGENANRAGIGVFSEIRMIVVSGAAIRDLFIALNASGMLQTGQGMQSVAQHGNRRKQRQKQPNAAFMSGLLEHFVTKKRKTLPDSYFY